MGRAGSPDPATSLSFAGGQETPRYPKLYEQRFTSKGFPSPLPFDPEVSGLKGGLRESFPVISHWPETKQKQVVKEQ